MPGSVKRIVCLANSYKNGERCIAGKELDASDTGDWIRPVSARAKGEVSGRERRYKDGSEPDLLDVIDVALIEAQPQTYQTENWLLDPAIKWAKTRKAVWKDLAALVDTPKSLWINGHHTAHGVNDHVPEGDAKTLRGSLYLIQLDKMKVHVLRQHTSTGGSIHKVRGEFKYRGVDYNLKITDPYADEHFRVQGDGVYPVEQCYLTLSLGEPFQGACYKLIAGIVTKKRANR